MSTTPLLVALAGILAIGLVACGSEETRPTPTAVARAPVSTPTAQVVKSGAGQTEIKLYMSEATGTYQTGEATITDLGGKTRIVVNVAPAMASAQPIHVHVGTCSSVGSIANTLENVVAGKSETELEKPMSEIASGGKVINVHLSFSEIRTYTACADIPALAAAAPADRTPLASGVAGY